MSGRRHARILPSLAAGLFAAALIAGQAVAASVVWETDVTADLLRLAYPSDDAFDPIVATHPSDPNTLAVSFHVKPANSRCSATIPTLRFSTDGGQSWSKAPRKPWASSNRSPNWHATIAWGPGPREGSARLYWADTTVSDCKYIDHRLSIAYSDDMGATWSTLFVDNGVPATPAGGYPEIAVDRNPASPNYGAVYAAINWFPNSSTEPGMRVLASGDFGAHWTAAEVSPLSRVAGYPFRYRIGYRLRAAPDGAVYAAFCQRDRTSPTGGTGRLAYGVARLSFDRQGSALTAAPAVLATKLGNNGFNLSTRYAPGTADRTRLGACWSSGLDVDGDTGRVYLAVSNYRTKVAAPNARGVIKLGQSDDQGQTWQWQNLPSLPAVNGRGQSAHKPALVVAGQTVFVGFHVMTDVALSSGRTSIVTIGNAYTVSTDGGATFSTPELISSARWNPDWLDHTRQGGGLRDRAELTADGHVFYAYADGRDAAAAPDARWGRCQVYAALIDLN
jgi:hypothetical protein